jgi:hypothetical protein
MLFTQTVYRCIKSFISLFQILGALLSLNENFEVKCFSMQMNVVVLSLVKEVILNVSKFMILFFVVSIPI